MSTAATSSRTLDRWDKIVNTNLAGIEPVGHSDTEEARGPVQDLRPSWRHRVKRQVVDPVLRTLEPGFTATRHGVDNFFEMMFVSWVPGRKKPLRPLYVSGPGLVHPAPRRRLNAAG